MRANAIVLFDPVAVGNRGRVRAANGIVLEVLGQRMALAAGTETSGRVPFDAHRARFVR